MRLVVHVPRERIGDSAPLAEVLMFQGPEFSFEMETDKGIMVSSHFINAFIDDIEGAFMTFPNGRTFSFSRPSDNQSAIMVTLVTPQGSRLADIQPSAVHREPELVQRGPRQK